MPLPVILESLQIISNCARPLGSDTSRHPLLQGPHRHGPLRRDGCHRWPRRRLQREREARLQAALQGHGGDLRVHGQEAGGEDALAQGFPRGAQDGARGRKNR